MYSFILPHNVEISQAPGYLKIEGPFGIVIKKTADQPFSIITFADGRRLFTSDQGNSNLAYLFPIIRGLSHGFRCHLSLTGIGFRATIREDFPINLYTQNFIRKRSYVSCTEKGMYLRLKIGFSHEVVYTSNALVNVQTSRLESRTKGTLISLKSNRLTTLNQAAAEIRSFRTPDSYKGKGIYFEREVVKLKKGKRQG